MRPRQPALQFRMELHGQKPRMIFDLDNFNKIAFRPNSGDTQSVILQRLAIGIVDLKPMAMTFGNRIAPEYAMSQGSA